jgi:hypothetical protein
VVGLFAVCLCADFAAEMSSFETAAFGEFHEGHGSRCQI